MCLIETIVSVANLVDVSRPGWPGCCCSYETGCGPLETIVSVAKVKVPGLGNQGVAVAMRAARNHCFSCKSDGFQAWVARVLL